MYVGWKRSNQVSSGMSGKILLGGQASSRSEVHRSPEAWVRLMCSKNGQNHCSDRRKVRLRGRAICWSLRDRRDQIMEFLIGPAKELNCRFSALKFVCRGFACCWWWWWLCFGFVSLSIMNLGVAYSDLVVRKIAQAGVGRWIEEGQRDQLGSCCKRLRRG